MGGREGDEKEEGRALGASSRREHEERVLRAVRESGATFRLSKGILVLHRDGSCLGDPPPI